METNQNGNLQELENAGGLQEEAQDVRQEPAAEEIAPEAEATAPEEPEQAVQPEAEPENKPEVEPEMEPEKAPGKQKKKSSLGKLLRSNRFKRGGMATLMSVVFIAIVVVVNILVGALTERFPSMNIDLTAQKLNSLSDQAMKVAQGVEQDTAIYLIGAEDSYRKNRLYSGYGLEYSQVANLAEKLQEANSKISVEFIDPDSNPGFISQYASENLTTGMVLVKTEKRHKALEPSDLFDVKTNSNTGRTETFSKVDSALAGALELVNMDKVPLLTVVTGHGEMLSSDNLSAFQSLMEEQNFEVREIDFLTEEIPEETQLLMLPTPTTDYTEEEIQKLRDYLDDETRPEEFALLVTCHTTQGDLPHLNSFLEEWGIRVEEGVVAETDSSRVALRNAGYVLANPSEEILQDNQYPYLIAAASRPLTLLFEGNGDVSAQALWTTADSAYVATEDMTEAEAENPETSQQTVAAIAAKYAQVDGSYLRRSVVVFGSSYVFTSDFMNASAFSDRDYISDLMKYCTATDGSAVSVWTQQVQTHVLDVTASVELVNLLGLGVFTIGLPVLILVIGLVIFLKRRHL